MLEFLDLKMIIAILAALLLLGGGLLKDIGRGLKGGGAGDILERIKDSVGNIINLEDFKVAVQRDIEVEGEVTYTEDYDLKGISAEEVTLSYPSEEMNVTADGKNIEVEGGEGITFGDFSGDLNVSPENVEMDGEVGSIESRYLSIEGKSSLKGEGGFRNLSLGGVELEKLEVKEGKGEIQVGTSAVLSAEKNPFTLSGFLGNVTFTDGVLKVNGNVSEVTTEKEGISISAGS